MPENSSQKVLAGDGSVNAHQLLDSTHLLHNDVSQARQRFKQHGYLLVRGLIPPYLVSEARGHILVELAKTYPSCISRTGKQKSEEVSLSLLTRQDIASLPEVLSVLECEELACLAACLYQTKRVRTTSFKWLRAVRPGEFTGLHSDRVFVGSSTSELITVWIPFQAIGPDEGGMLVCQGSHRSRGFARLRESYGRSSVGQDGTESGWLTRNGADLDTELEGQSQWIDWRTTSFKEGDVLVLHQDLLHMTACNKSELYRISCDTRWQPSSQALDPRLGTWSSFAVE